jgi:hypothetical protein
VRYRGDLNIYYRETVTVVNINGNNSQALTRTGRLVTPIDVYIQRLYAAELAATTSIVVREQKIDPGDSPDIQAAITATLVRNIRGQCRLQQM